MTEHELKPLPIGLQTFSDLREGGYVYIDKTELIHQMVKDPKGVYFLSRPRRFGKSLLISTLESLFLGRQELFDGLWIGKSNYKWEIFPVIRLDMSAVSVDTCENLKQDLTSVLQGIGEQFGIELTKANLPLMFGNLIQSLASKTGKKVVVLVDEYDKPIIAHLTEPEIAEKNRAVLKDFYSVLKSQDANLRFVFLTGVSKFAKVSIFSELNNLNDISMNDKYSTLLGYTQTELETYFKDWIETACRKMGLTHPKMLDELKRWYNGYCFCEDAPFVYNPFSILLFLDNQKFKNYWFESGTPTMLVNLIQKQQDLIPEQFEDLVLSRDSFNAFLIERPSLIPLMLQTGYLTIKSYLKERDRYQIDYPNHEVRESFNKCLLSGYSGLDVPIAVNYLDQFCSQVEKDETDEMMKTMKRFFNQVPYDIHISKEKYYQSLFYLVFKLMGYQIEAEVRTNTGRIDVVLETQQKIYVMEFKLDGTKEEALEQIQKSGYAQKYEGKGKTIVCLGISFSFEERNIRDWVCKTYPLSIT